MKHARAIVTAGVLLVLFGALFWQSRTFFLHNKITFLLNQKQFDEATALVEKLYRNDPSASRTKALRIKAMTLTGRYADAAAQEIDEDVIKDSPQVLYWLALSRWQLSHNQLARDLAQQFLATKESLPDLGSMLIAKSLAGETEPLPEPTERSRIVRLLFPLEQGVYYGISANQQFRLGRFVGAANLYKDAFNLGARNTRTLLNGAEASAIAGDASQAEMLLAFSGTGSVAPLYRKLLESYEEYKSGSRTILDKDIAGRAGRVDLARALAWSASAYLSEDLNANMYPVLRVMAELQQEYPYDRIITTRMAGVLEKLRRYDEAYALYKKLYDDAPNLVLALRMWALEAVPETQVTAKINGFMASVATIDSVTTAAFTGDSFVNKRDFITFYQEGSASLKVDVPEAGAYAVTIVARGDKAENRWPLLRVTIDEQLAGHQYICRDSWDCYSLDLVLEAGSHDILLEYVNGNTALDSTSDKRTFSIRSVYLTKPGAA